MPIPQAHTQSRSAGNRSGAWASLGVPGIARVVAVGLAVALCAGACVSVGAYSPVPQTTAPAAAPGSPVPATSSPSGSAKESLGTTASPSAVALATQPASVAPSVTTSTTPSATASQAPTPEATPTPTASPDSAASSTPDPSPTPAPEVSPEPSADPSPDPGDATPGRTSEPGASSRPRGKPSDKRRLTLVATRTGGITPKSVVATQDGRFFAQNVMYGHSITVFNRRLRRVRTISDQINLARFGYREYRGKVRGAPVEATLSADGRHMYVSQYSMYGSGFPNPGFDACLPGHIIDRSFVYRIGVKSLLKTGAYRVGAVPKYLAASPNGRYLLVANWCSWDVSVVDLKRGREIKRIKVGANPRGIAFTPDSRKAYVSVVGEGHVHVIDMRKLKIVRTWRDLGIRPRHLVMSPNGRYLYVTVEGWNVPGRRDGSILKLNRRTGKLVKRVGGLDEPRTTVIAPDGRSLYVVDYNPGTVVKIATRDMSVLQTVKLGRHPIGVDYDRATRKIWVAGYTGHMWVLKDR